MFLFLYRPWASPIRIVGLNSNRRQASGGDGKGWRTLKRSSSSLLYIKLCLYRNILFVCDAQALGITHPNRRFKLKPTWSIWRRWKGIEDTKATQPFISLPNAVIVMFHCFFCDIQALGIAHPNRRFRLQPTSSLWRRWKGMDDTSAQELFVSRLDVFAVARRPFFEALAK